MINYYKILGIQNYASREEIKAAYRRKAKEFHPDLHPENPEAEEIFKLIHEGYEIVGNPIKKGLYDRRLQVAYLIEVMKTKSMLQRTKRRFLSREDWEGWAKKQREYEVAEFRKSTRYFPINYQMALAAMIGLWGLQIFYSNWFVNNLEYNAFLMIVGMAIFISGLFFFIAGFYRKYRIISFLRRLRFDYEGVSVYLFAGLLLLGPAAVVGLNQYRHYYHLKHYPQVEVGRVVAILDNSHFEVEYNGNDNKLIRKNFFVSKKAIYDLDEGWILVRFSRADPLIAKIQERGDSKK